MMWYEIWYNKQHDEYAVLSAWCDDTFSVDLGCMLWNRQYKRCSAAVKYLEKCGYEKQETVITLGKNPTCPTISQTGKLIERKGA